MSRHRNGYVNWMLTTSAPTIYGLAGRFATFADRFGKAGIMSTTSTPEATGLERDALGPWGVFAQGLAAAAPSVAVAVVPFSLFVAAGNGAAWAAVIGLAITVLIAVTISFQAKRTVSSGSLGTYTGNGLGPG